MNQDLSIVQLLLNASWVVQAVVLILLLVSVMSWAAIFRKLLSLKQVKNLNEGNRVWNNPCQLGYWPTRMHAVT